MGCEDRRYESDEDTAERERWNADNDGSERRSWLSPEEFRAANKQVTFQEKPFYRVSLAPVENTTKGGCWRWEVVHHVSHAPGKWTKKSVAVGFRDTENDAEHAARSAVERHKQAANTQPRTFDIS